jgi:sugar lactone lactonase YvrE
MWHASRFVWHGWQRASSVAVHHPSVHPSLESLEDRTAPASALTILPTNLISAVGSTPPPLQATGGQDVLSTFASGLNFNQDMAFDHGGNLFVANQSGGNVIEITPQGIQSVFASGFTEPKGLAFDSQGNLYVSNQAGNSISKVSPVGVVSTFVASIDQPGGLAVDKLNNLYVTDEGTGNISKVTPAGVVSVFAHTGSYPRGLAFDQSGNLFVSNEGDNTISEVTPGGVVSTFIASGAGLSGPAGMTFDLLGNLYVANYDNGTVSYVTPTGTVLTFLTGLSGPTDTAWNSNGLQNSGLYISQGWANNVQRFGPSPVTFIVAPADASKLSAIGLTLNTDGSFLGHITSVPASPLTFTVNAIDNAGDSGSATVTLTVQAASKWALISVTPSPTTFQTSNSPQLVLLNASAKDSSTGQPVTEGMIAFTIYSGNDSTSPVLGQISAISVNSQGNVATSFTVPANTPPGNCLIVAHYTDQGGSYSTSDGSAYLTIQPASPVSPPTSPPVPVTSSTPPVTTGPISSPVTPSGAQSQSTLLRNAVLTTASPVSAGNFMGIGTSLNFSTGPSGPFAITANMPATQVLGGYPIPAFLSPWFSEPIASPSVTSVVLDVPPVPFLPSGFGRPTTASLTMEVGPQAESDMLSLSEVTTTALRLGTSLSDADDSAELFYNLARKGTESGQVVAEGRAETPGDVPTGLTSEAAAQAVHAGDAGQ